MKNYLANQFGITSTIDNILKNNKLYTIVDQNGQIRKLFPSNFEYVYYIRLLSCLSIIVVHSR